MAKVKATQGFTDKEKGVFRAAGDTFSCTEARARFLMELGLVKVVEDAPEVKPKKKTTTKAKK